MQRFIVIPFFILLTYKEIFNLKEIEIRGEYFEERKRETDKKYRKEYKDISSITSMTSSYFKGAATTRAMTDAKKRVLFFSLFEMNVFQFLLFLILLHFY